MKENITELQLGASQTPYSTSEDAATTFPWNEIKICVYQDKHQSTESEVDDRTPIRIHE